MLSLSDLQEICQDIEEVVWCPAASGVRLGCDCGCGGDNYTIEEWDKVHKRAEEAEERIVQFCKEHDIFNDIFTTD